MEKKTTGWAAAAVAALVLGGGFYLSQTDEVKEATGTTSGFSGTSANGNSVVETKNVFTGSQKAIVSPEKQEVVKEGFSGQKTPAIGTQGVFTGSSNIVISPEKPTVLKEGFSGSHKVTTTKGEFTGAGGEGREIPKPEEKTPQATPGLKQVTPGDLGEAIPTQEEKTPQATPGLKQETPDLAPGATPDATPSKSPSLVPDKIKQTDPKPMVAPTASKEATPTINDDKAIKIIEGEVKEGIKNLNKIEKQLEALEKSEK